MANDINKLMALCAEDLGYTEGSNNDTKFGKWYGLNNQPWCAMSASKKYFDAGMITAIANTKKGFASCDAWMKYLAKNNQLVPIGQAKAGDVVFFQFDEDAEPDHVGIVKGNNATLKYMYCWEGNTSSGKAGSQSNGDGYYLKKRDYKLVMAVGRPK